MTRTWIINDKGIIQLPGRQLYSYYEGDKWSHVVWTLKAESGILSFIITPEILPTTEELLPLLIYASFFSTVLKAYHEIYGLLKRLRNTE